MKIFVFILILIQLLNLYEFRNIAIISGNKGRWRNNYYIPESEIKDVRFYYISYNVHGSSYGDTFGSNRLESNTHIYNANYKNYVDENKPFLAESLFKNQKENSDKSELRGWKESFDRRWRKTTKLPYFANEIPSENEKLSAAVVVGKIHVSFFWCSEFKSSLVGDFF